MKGVRGSNVDARRFDHLVYHDLKMTKPNLGCSSAVYSNRCYGITGPASALRLLAPDIVKYMKFPETIQGA